MNDLRLPTETHIGRTHLVVADRDRSLRFYQGLLGFITVSRDGGGAALSATGRPPVHLILEERRGAEQKSSGTTGLYHVAIRYPSRRALAQTFRRLVAHRWRFQGAADHLVSEALYLTDPDGNGLELYVDRPRDQWRMVDGQITMGTEPLDVDDLLSDTDDDVPWTGVDPRTDIGHVHLSVSDLARAEAFYGKLLGLDVTQRSFPGALFLSAGGYHHHLGLNVWAGVGAPPPAREAVGLASFALVIPDLHVLQALAGRLQENGVRVERLGEGEDGFGVLVRDPDGNGVELVTRHEG